MKFKITKNLLITILALIVSIFIVTSIVLININQDNDHSSAAAPSDPSSTDYSVDTLVGGKNRIWAMDLLPNGDLIYTEKAGKVNLLSGGTSSLIEDLNIGTFGEGGLMGIAVDPDFATNNYIYVMYTYDLGVNSSGCIPEGTRNKIARFTYNPGGAPGNGLTNETELLVLPGRDGGHNGGRIKFGPDGKLYIAMGDVRRATYADSCGDVFVQDVNQFHGKILRMNKDGSAPNDNPFFGQGVRADYVYTVGHRNPQGLAWDDAGNMYSSEHGTGSNDEINKIVAGGNYGWDHPDFDVNGNNPHGECDLDKAALPPNIINAYWCSVPGTDYGTGIGGSFSLSGIEIVGDYMFIAGLKQEQVRIIDLTDNTPFPGSLFLDAGERVRDVISIADESCLYIATDNPGNSEIRELCWNNLLPNVTLPTPDQIIVEGETGTFEITLDKDATETLQIPLIIAPSNGLTAAEFAITGVDYNATTNVLTINPGERSKTLTLTINEDLIVETDETLDITIDVNNLDTSKVQNPGNNRNTQFTIQDNDVASTTYVASILTADRNINEGNATTFIVSLDTPNNTGSDIIIPINYTGGTAGVQYNSPATAIIPNGQSTVTVTFTSLNDANTDDEVITAKLASPADTNVTITTNVGEDDVVINITDTSVINEPPEDQSETGNIDEGATKFFDVLINTTDDSDSKAQFEIELLDDSDNVVTTLTLPHGVATVEFTSGVNQIKFVANEDADSNDETQIIKYRIKDSNGAVSTPSSTLTLTITDNDVAPTTYIASILTPDRTINEPGTTTFVVSIDKVNNTGANIVIPIIYTGGTVGDQFSAATSASIAPGASSISLSFNSLNDTDTNDEVITATLGTPTNTNVTVSTVAGQNNVVININDDDVANTAPISVNDSASFDRNGGVNNVTIDVLDNDTDVDGDTLNLNSFTSGTTTSNGGVVTKAGGELVYTNTTNFTGIDTFTYKANDGVLDSNNTATVTITVTDSTVGANNNPVANNDAVSIDKNTNSSISISVLNNDTDADGDTLEVNTFNSTSANGGTITQTGSNTSALVYTPSTTFVGTDTFTYTISDGNGGSDTGTVTITVTDSTVVNTSPVATNTSYTITNTNTVNTSISSLYSDVDTTDTLSVSITTTPTNGVATLSSVGQLVYTPNTSYVGTDSLVYTVSDGNGGSDTGTINFNIVDSTSSNNIPIANDKTITVDKNSSSNDLNVSYSDLDTTDTLTLSIVTSPSNGVATIVDGKITYTPNVGYVGLDTLTYKVNDGTVDSSTAKVDITIQETEEEVANPNLSVTTPTNNSTTSDLTPTFSGTGDAGDTITLKDSNGNILGTTIVNSNGTYSITPSTSLTSSTNAQTFTITATDKDDNTKTTSKTITLTVSNVNKVLPATGADDDARNLFYIVLITGILGVVMYFIVMRRKRKKLVEEEVSSDH